MPSNPGNPPTDVGIPEQPYHQILIELSRRASSERQDSCLARSYRSIPCRGGLPRVSKPQTSSPQVERCNYRSSRGEDVLGGYSLRREDYWKQEKTLNGVLPRTSKHVGRRRTVSNQEALIEIERKDCTATAEEETTGGLVRILPERGL